MPLVRVLKAVEVAGWTLGFALGIVIVAYIGISLMIGSDVNKTSQRAMAQFTGDRVEALIALVDCEGCSLHDRNLAVWTLGQLRDKRGLPVMHKYYTGEPFNHEWRICQYVISKAIRWTEGKSFMLPQVWRLMLRNDRPRAMDPIRKAESKFTQVKL